MTGMLVETRRPLTGRRFVVALTAFALLWSAVGFVAALVVTR